MRVMESAFEVAQARGKRRWYQFNLRTLLVLTFVCAIPCAWLGNRIERKREERAAVGALRELGATVTYDYEFDHIGPAGPDWARALFGENFFDEVDCITFDNGAVINDDALMNCRGFSHLTWLNLYDTNVTDAGLVHLKGLTRLCYLNLGKTKVTDAGLTNITELKQLDQLGLEATAVTDAGIQHLKGLAQLRVLDLMETAVTDSGVSEIERTLPNCSVSIGKYPDHFPPH